MSVSYFTEMGTCVLSNRSLCSGVCVVFDHVEVVLCSAYCDGRCADVSLSIHSSIADMEIPPSNAKSTLVTLFIRWQYGSPPRARLQYDISKVTNFVSTYPTASRNRIKQFHPCGYSTV